MNTATRLQFVRASPSREPLRPARGERTPRHSSGVLTKPVILPACRFRRPAGNTSRGASPSSPNLTEHRSTIGGQNDFILRGTPTDNSHDVPIAGFKGQSTNPNALDHFHLAKGRRKKRGAPWSAVGSEARHRPVRRCGRGRQEWKGNLLSKYVRDRKFGDLPFVLNATSKGSVAFRLLPHSRTRPAISIHHESDGSTHGNLCERKEGRTP
jgi:hypothetical protein